MIFCDKEMTLDAKIDRLEFGVVVACWDQERKGGRIRRPRHANKAPGVVHHTPATAASRQPAPRRGACLLRLTLSRAQEDTIPAGGWPTRPLPAIPQNEASGHRPGRSCALSVSRGWMQQNRPHCWPVRTRCERAPLLTGYFGTLAPGWNPTPARCHFFVRDVHQVAPDASLGRFPAIDAARMQ